ncbi:hypothetical protein [Xanthomarina sp. F2636L]|uniref:hypothetical protein n=1 Tax=Xanthomarina sp. F2636L TaxID=2996018 RepID=UPI00225E6E69|nr:hypothetical protein [Xanthomarina sp. F2636L]
MSSERVKLYIKAITKLCNGKARSFIIDVRGSRGTFSSAAANLFAKTPSLVALRISEAYIQNSIGIRILIGSYKRIYDPITPFGVFSDMESAKEFCINQNNKNFSNLCGMVY